MIIKKNNNFIYEETGELISPKFLSYSKPQDYIDSGVKFITPMTAKEYLNEMQLEEMMTSDRYYAETKFDGCFREDMRVTMSDGSLKPISEVSMGESVMSFNESKRVWEKKEVLTVFDNGVGGDWLKITFEVGDIIREIVCTENHKFYLRGEYVEAKNLKVNDYLLFFI